MNVVSYVPLLLALALVGLLALGRMSGRVDALITRIAVAAFGEYVETFRTEHPDRRAALQAARVPITYREYGARSYLYAAIGAVVGSFLGIYLVWGVLLALAIDPETMREALPPTLEFLANVGGLPTLSPSELLVFVSISAITFGALSAGGTYWLRWWYPSYVADERARRIETSLPATVAFTYALSKSGMEFPRVIRILAENEATYGEAAAEFEVAVRQIDTFGTDVITALGEMGRRTPSGQFQEFSENLVGVLQSGHSLSAFLERQYHDYREEAESRQQNTLSLLGTLAEAYVTVLVAGPLFLITILVVIGFSVEDTTEPLQALIYLVLPFANLAFIIYLSVVTDRIDPGGTDFTDPSTLPTVTLGDDLDPVTDGGVDSPIAERLRIYRRLRELRRRLGDPIGAVLERPERLFYLTVPIAIGAIGLRIVTSAAAGRLGVEAIDTALAVVAVFVLGTFAVAYELHRRRIDAIEAAIPDLLERLAGVNRAGMPIVSAIDHVRGPELGALADDVDRIWADLQWGADLQTALERFGSRVRTRVTSRMVTLLTESMNASGNLSDVLRIAARQAAADRRLKRERKGTMTEYMVVVYVSFLVFLFIVAILSTVLLASLPTEPIGGIDGVGGSPAGLTGVGQVDVEAFERLLFHATLVQGLLSGLIAGQLSTGDVRAGAKHATVLVAIAIGLFVVVL